MHTVFQSETAGSSENQRLMELETTKQDLEYRLQEMTKTVEKQQEMLAMAKRDPLTGLRNRQGFPELVNASLRARCEGIFFIMDLDNFKSINDTYGHMEGDRVLVRFAKALKAVMDLADIIARLGGDEFVVFSPECYDKYEVKAKAQRFIRQIERSIVTPDRPMQVTISMGIAAAPHDGVTYEALYRNADKALYSVKRNGKAQWRTYDENTMGGDMGGHAIDYETEDNSADEELLKSRDLTKVFIELSAGEKTSDAAMYKIIRYIAEKFSINWFQIMQVNCTEDLVTIKYEWCSESDFRNNAGRSGYYVHSDIMRFRESFEKNPIFVITPESTAGFSPKFQREFEKNMKYSVVYIANITANDTFYMFVCTRFDKNDKWKDDEALELNAATKLMSMYVSQADRETDNERRYREMVDFERKTGLYSMPKFYEQLGRLRKIAAENDEEVAIIHTDFHQFIKFNRKFGLDAGDNMLISFANSIQRNDDPEHSIATHIDSTDIFISAKRTPKGDRSFMEAVDRVNKDFCNAQNKIYKGANIILKSGIYILKRNDTGGDALDWAVMAKNAVKDFNESFCAVYEE